MSKRLPYKIVDRSGQNRYGVVVNSLQALMKKGNEKFGMQSGMKVVLENDGTEVDEEEYFSTLEPNTCFMILKPDEDWIHPSHYDYLNAAITDETDATTNGNGNKKRVIQLLHRIRSDAAHITMLGGSELELLSDMDPDSLADIIPNTNFLGEVKEASSRFLNDRRDAKDALELLKMYHAATNNLM